MSKKKLQDLRKIVKKRMKELRVSRSQLINVVSKTGVCCGRTLIYFLDGKEIGHEKIEVIFHMLGIKVGTGD